MTASCKLFLRWFCAVVFAVFLSSVAKADDWPPIDPADLAMKTFPQQPGAAAVILLREENDDDPLHFHATYKRIKILTEAGRDFGNVELPYYRGFYRIDSVTGRTIHADGSIVPFAGKPFDKTVDKGRGYKVNIKSFTMPDVQVGSIIEYRYSLRYNDNGFVAPVWTIQENLFQKRATFKFTPFQFTGSVYLKMSHDRVVDGLAWSKYVPSKDMEPKENKLPRTYFVDLSVSDVPPLLEEPYSPPEKVSRWRVNFYYTSGSKESDYWKDEGKYWNKDVESFLNHRDGAHDVLAKAIAAGDTPEQKVKKLYAFVASLENRSYIPHRSDPETRVLEIKENESAEEVLRQKSGNHDDLNRLLVALAREADIPAWMIWVPDRSDELFDSHYLSTSQFDAEIAIVLLNGKEVFLDPGTKYCPYGLLDWRYAGNRGLRQSQTKGTEFGEIPLSGYNDATVQRLARLKLNDDGRYEGTVTLGFTGLEALRRRRVGGHTDDEGRKKSLEEELRTWLPGGSEITLSKKPRWDDAESTLAAEFKVSGPLATSAGKRWSIPPHLFEVNERPRFPTSQRTNPVYLFYPYREIDEVHIALPAGMDVESLPPDDLVKMEFGLYKTTQKMESPTTVFSRRDMAMAGMAFTAAEYKDVKDFYDKVKAGDDQPALLKAPARASN